MHSPAIFSTLDVERQGCGAAAGLHPGPALVGAARPAAGRGTTELLPSLGGLAGRCPRRRLRVASGLRGGRPGRYPAGATPRPLPPSSRHSHGRQRELAQRRRGRCAAHDRRRRPQAQRDAAGPSGR